VLGLAISTVSLTALQSVAQNSSTLNGQNYNSVAREAAQAGVNAAGTCIKKDGQANWNTNPLKPGTDCTGAGTATTITDNTAYSSTYSVAAVDQINSGSTLAAIKITSTGTVSVKGPGGITANTITQTVRTIVKTTTATGGTVSKNVTQISTGPSTTCAVTGDEGKAYCWGSNANGQLGAGKNVYNDKQSSPIAVSVNPSAQAALAGHSYCASYVFGICRSTVTDLEPTPAQPASALAGKFVTKISVGTTHTCVVAKDTGDATGASRRAYCWGKNDSGQLGNRTTTDSLTPVAVDTMATDYTPPPVTPSPCGGWFQPSCTPVAQPTQPKSAIGGKTIVDITAGSSFTCALTSDGIVSCWGDNSSGELGTNNTTDYSYPVSLYKSDAYSVTTPAYCSGSIIFGNCVGTWVPASTTNYPPTALWGKTLKTIAEVKDSRTMCVTDTSNKVYCWGENESGQVGDQQYQQTKSSTASSTCGPASTYPPTPDSPPATFPDVLQPQAVMTTLTFDTIVSVPGYVTARTPSSDPTNPLRMYKWGGYSSSLNSVSHTRDVCGSDSSSGGGGGGSGNNKYIRRTTASYTLTAIPPIQILYDQAVGTNALSKQPLTLVSGNAYNGLFCAQTGGNLYCDANGSDTSEGQTGSGFVSQCSTTGVWPFQSTSCTSEPTGPRPVIMDPFGSNRNFTDMDTGSGGHTCAVSNNTVYCWGANDMGQL